MSVNTSIHCINHILEFTLTLSGDASFGNRKLPKEFHLPSEDPVLSARLPALDDDGLDFRLASSTVFEDDTPVDDVFSHPSIEYTSVNVQDVIEKRPLKKRRTKRSPTATGLKDEELPSPVFVSDHPDEVPVAAAEASDDEAFIKQLFTSTVLKGRAKGFKEAATRAPGDDHLPANVS